MNIRIMLNAALIAAYVLSGCSTPPPPSQPPPEPVVVVTPPPPPKAVVSKPKTKPKARPNPPSAPSPLKVAVRHGGGSSRIVEDRAVAAMKNELSCAGYVVDGPGEPDIVITATGSRNHFDRTGKSAVCDGSLRLRAEAKGKSPFFIEEKTFAARGKRGVDDAEAEEFLADALMPQVGTWSKNAAGRGKDKIAPGGRK